MIIPKEIDALIRRLATWVALNGKIDLSLEEKFDPSKLPGELMAWIEPAALDIRNAMLDGDSKEYAEQLAIQTSVAIGAILGIPHLILIVAEPNNMDKLMIMDKERANAFARMVAKTMPS